MSEMKLTEPLTFSQVCCHQSRESSTSNHQGGSDPFPVLPGHLLEFSVPQGLYDKLSHDKQTDH